MQSTCIQSSFLTLVVCQFVVLLGPFVINRAAFQHASLMVILHLPGLPTSAQMILCRCISHHAAACHLSRVKGHTSQKRILAMISFRSPSLNIFKTPGSVHSYLQHCTRVSNLAIYKSMSSSWRFNTASLVSEFSIMAVSVNSVLKLSLNSVQILLFCLVVAMLSRPFWTSLMT